MGRQNIHLASPHLPHPPITVQPSLASESDRKYDGGSDVTSMVTMTDRSQATYLGDMYLLLRFFSMNVEYITESNLFGSDPGLTRISLKNC